VAPKQNYNINWATEKGISYSQYSLYNQCQHRWKLQYVDKIKVFEPSIFLVFGTAFHETLQEFIKVMYEQSAKAANQLDLETFLKERMLESYKEIYDNNGNIHFAKPDDFKEFIADGMTLLNWIKSKRGKFFNIKNTKLVGIEIPVKGLVSEDYPNIFMIGSIDLVIYEKNTESYTIYDIKTSTRGWSDSDKRDEVKINQILLYKHYYSKLLNVPLDKVDVKFFIVKRKPYENPDFPTHRVQEFIPANGTKKVEKAVNQFKQFINSCYDKSGNIIEREFSKNTNSCKYCPFNNKPDLCSR
jgi:uncharacterized protein Veg